MMTLDEFLLAYDLDINDLNDASFYYVCYSAALSEEFIRKYQDKVNWSVISWRQKLSEDFIREFKDKICWVNISTSQKLSEDFIREFKDYVRWRYISQYKKLSEDFILEFKDKVKLEYIITCFYSENLQEHINTSWKYKKI